MGDEFPSIDQLFERSPDAPRFKSRTIILEFDAVEAGGEAAFVNSLVQNITDAREKMLGGIGFIVKHATYFNTEGSFWVVLVSRDALLNTKWEYVYTGIGAKQMRLNQTNYFIPGVTRNSLYGVAQMFAEHTTMLELVGNRIDYSIDPEGIPRCGGRDCRAKKSPARSIEDSPSSARAKNSPTSSSSARPETPKLMQTRLSRHGSPSSAFLGLCRSPSPDALTTPPTRSKRRTAQDPTPLTRTRLSDQFKARRVQEPLTPLQEIVRESVAFLKADSLESATEYINRLHEFGANAYGGKSVVNFLVDGCVQRVFALAVRLKEIIHDFLASRFGMTLDTLSLLELTAHPAFESLKDEDKRLLSDVGTGCDRVSEHITFLLIDPVSVGTFIAVYVLGEECDGAFSGGSIHDDFLGCHVSAIAEHVFGYAQFVQVMSRFLNHLVADMRLDPILVFGLVSPDTLDERGVFVSFLCGMLPSFVPIKLAVSKQAFRRTAFDATLARIRRKFHIETLGVTFDTWNTMQICDGVFNKMRQTDPLLLHLPRTDFSDPNAHHSCDIRDIGLLANAARKQIGRSPSQTNTRSKSIPV